MAELYKYTGDPLTSPSVSARRNNQDYITDFLNNALTYVGQTGFTYQDGSTPIYDPTAWAGIDCSTYVHMCLMGYAYNETPYYTHTSRPISSWVANPEHDWSMSTLDYIASSYANGSNPTAPKTAAGLAHWMVRRGWVVDTSDGLCDVMPGDIVFWARKSSGEWVNPSRYMHINHVGIVASREAAPDTYEYQDGTGGVISGTWDKTRFPYKHTTLEVAASLFGAVSSSEVVPCITRLLERGQGDPTNDEQTNVNTIVLVCRPDLGAMAPSGGGGGGSGPSPYNMTPAMDSENGFSGSATTYARGDHSHPRDKSKLSANQGSANSGKVLVVGSDGAISPKTLSEAGAAPAITEVTVSTVGAVTQALDAGTIYHFTGALTSLTITFNAASGVPAQYHFDFTEGSTAFDPTLPSGVVLPDGHTWEADTRYEVDILNNYAVVVGWAVSV